MKIWWGGLFSLFEFLFPKKFGLFVSTCHEEFRVLDEDGAGGSEHDQIFQNLQMLVAGLKGAALPAISQETL